MLVPGIMFQAGGVHVEKHVASDVVMMDTLDVSTVKLVIYRDEVTDAWSEVTQTPVRYILKHMPPLRYCQDVQCNCPAWHNKEKLDIQDVILDVWWRQTLTLSFKACKAKESELFSALFRIPTCVKDAVLTLSSNAGIYCEPRSLDGKTNSFDKSFAVVWCPNLTTQELNAHETFFFVDVPRALSQVTKNRNVR